MSNPTKPIGKWSRLKAAFAAGQAIESRQKTVGGIWAGWKPATNPNWHTTGDTQYRKSKP